MGHSAAFALCLAGFATLAFATRRQQRDFIGRPLRRATTLLLRAAGASALLLALGILVGGYGWSLALVMFSGHIGLAAGIVYCMLLGYARMQPSRSRHR